MVSVHAATTDAATTAAADERAPDERDVEAAFGQRSGAVLPERATADGRDQVRSFSLSAKRVDSPSMARNRGPMDGWSEVVTESLAQVGGWQRRAARSGATSP